MTDQQPEANVQDDATTKESPSAGERAGRLMVGVQFRPAGDIYSFLTDDAELVSTDSVVVEGEHGESVATVIVASREVPAKDVPKNARKVVRRATDDDLRDHAKRREEARELFEMCEQKIMDHGLPMKLIDADLVEAGKKVIFFFSAEQRVDFRGLVKDLASALHRYIEMRQIGSRDASSFIGCMGPCGRTTCCSSFLRQFQSISIAMAKNQGLSPNPAKLTGMCGKLKCCLAYENKAYAELRKGLPKQNSWVETPKGVGKLVKLDILKQQCAVRLEGGGEVRLACRECRRAEGRPQEQRGQQKQQKQGGRRGERKRAGGDEKDRQAKDEGQTEEGGSGNE